jgi:hypothetical protein
LLLPLTTRRRSAVATTTPVLCYSRLAACHAEVMRRRVPRRWRRDALVARGSMATRLHQQSAVTPHRGVATSIDAGFPIAVVGCSWGSVTLAGNEFVSNRGNKVTEISLVRGRKGNLVLFRTFCVARSRFFQQKQTKAPKSSKGLWDDRPLTTPRFQSVSQ